MKRTYWTWLLGTAALWLVAAHSVSAISPSLVMIYGDRLEKPIYVQPRDPSEFPMMGIFWNTKRGGADYQTQTGGTVPNGLEGRAFLNFAVFWGRIGDPSSLKPERASQHGRLYLPSGSQPLVIVATAPWMNEPQPVPIPKDLHGFVSGWTVSGAELQQLKALGIPGL
jgi:hypothetical protein